GVLAGVAIAIWIGQPATAFPVTPFHAAGSSFLRAVGLGVSQSIWNCSGWDDASTIGGEIEHATTTYPRALARALPLVTAVYLVSVIPVLALTPWTSWTDGAWPDLATRVVGPWLGGWLAVAGMVSAFALFNALLLVYSRIPLVLAQYGLLPGALAATDARGTPRNAVLVSAAVYSVFALLPFGGLLAGDVLLYSAALALEFAALVRLRRTEPGLRGAFRVPVGVPLLVTLAALPILLLIAGVALEVRSRPVGLPGVLVAVLLAGSDRTCPRGGDGGRSASPAPRADHLRTRDQLRHRRRCRRSQRLGCRDAHHGCDGRQRRVHAFGPGRCGHVADPRHRLQAQHSPGACGPEHCGRAPRAGRLQSRSRRGHGPGDRRREAQRAQCRWDGPGGRPEPRAGAELGDRGPR